MFDGERRSFDKVARLHGLENAAMPLVGLRRVKFGLIEHRDEDGPCGQVTQDIDDDGVPAQFRDADMKIAHQIGQALAVARRHCIPLLVQMRVESFAALLRQHAHAAQQTGLDDTPRLINRDRIFGGRLDDKPASPRADMHDTAGLQAHHGFTDAGSGYAEERCQLVFAKPRTGPNPGRQDAGDDRRLDGLLRGLGCVALLHTREKAKRMPKSCGQDFQEGSDALREICLQGMQPARNLCGRRPPPRTDLLIVNRPGSGTGAGGAELPRLAFFS
ncbi:hypothetical protein RHECNPAF_2330063 [Rhizobium etli CNPAF512]|nr:hypothetical protein RHECNPAF_2330063 [Rhizobium etli CNPAF512]